MSLPREPANISDLERDAERYRQLVRMLQAARSQLGKIEVANPDIDQILERLLPDLTEALGAEQSFAAILRQVTNGDRHFELTHAYPSPELRGASIPWNAWMEDSHPNRTGVFAGATRTRVTGFGIWSRAICGAVSACGANGGYARYSYRGYLQRDKMQWLAPSWPATVAYWTPLSNLWLLVCGSVNGAAWSWRAFKRPLRPLARNYSSIDCWI